MGIGLPFAQDGALRQPVAATAGHRLKGQAGWLTKVGQQEQNRGNGP
jgi:hypothetical protein